MSRLTIGVMPIYGRCKLATWVLRKAKGLVGVDHIIAVGSGSGDEAAAEKAGVEYYPYENMIEGLPYKAIGLKWQHGFEIALQQGAEGILFLQSDDVWQADRVLKLWEELDKGAALAGPATWYLVMLEIGDVYFQRYKIRKDSIGTGRLYSARFLREKLNGILFKKDAPLRAMDKYASKMIKDAGGNEVTIEGISPAMLKLWEGKNEEQITAASVLLSSKNIITERIVTPFTTQILKEWREYNGC